MRIDFKHFTVPTGINGLHKQTGDARESFADIIYTMVNGIRAHALAMKIYKSDGAVEYTDDEVRLMKGLGGALLHTGVHRRAARPDTGRRRR